VRAVQHADRRAGGVSRSEGSGHSTYQGKPTISKGWPRNFSCSSLKPAWHGRLLMQDADWCGLPLGAQDIIARLLGM